MMTDPISDMLTRIRNASMVGKGEVVVARSKVKYAIAKILEKEGYVGEVETSTEGPKEMMKIKLKYLPSGPAIASVRRVSTPGRRVYKKAEELPVVRSHQGLAIVSTSSGLMTNTEARKRRLGGELICEVY